MFEYHNMKSQYLLWCQNCRQHDNQKVSGYNQISTKIFFQPPFYYVIFWFPCINFLNPPSTSVVMIVSLELELHSLHSSVFSSFNSPFGEHLQQAALWTGSAKTDLFVCYNTFRSQHISIMNRFCQHRSTNNKTK